MAVLSAGLLLFRRGAAGVEVLLGHMGGPYWARKDDGAWSIPKGEHEPDEDAFAAAEREFAEELGHRPPAGDSHELGTVAQRGGRKQITVFAREGDFDPEFLHPGTFDLEWPPKSGTMQAFPEIDRVAWFELDAARHKLVAAQVEFVDRLDALISAGSST
ncbi:NUDIX domain-containing protein [Pseudonocardia abyssalis]|uniref:NUDIX domain-containing protein n=1 Tax=Pseudonocardia abyssalis TaxID=2792008 RepID=A0ABS6UP50_9PSEU|nr:NUDIX domain-containing protein [Pseudonocardia abyssalis]MBW0119252.1 NUDIX domain-containing protein [Pseudonocardia abyssalis]MBW0134031.1 NUDIX domain-containing protein [Pseudonocardia abyssalis]